MGSKGGSGGGSTQSGFQATTSTYAPNPEAMQAYRNALGMAENVAQIPYEQYPGQMTAGFTPDQLAAFQGTREMQGYAQPYVNAAAQSVNNAMALSDPRNFTPAALQQYYNPYQQNVIESSRRMMEQQNAQQQADLTARAIQQGAYGGDRSGVARAALMGQQSLANQQVLSGLQQQGYQQAVQQYNQQQQQAIGAAQSGAYSLGQLGLQGQQAALQGIQALLGTGGMQQQLGQQQLSAAYNQWMQQRAYPYQQANFYAGIASGIAPNMGGTTNTFGIGNSQTQQQQASGGGGGAGLLTSALSFLPMLMGGSDRDDKTDIKYIGKHPETGEKLYEYRYKGDPKSYPKVVGPMAQDIEKDEPERVHEIGGHKIVEGLGRLAPSQREGRADGGSNVYSGQSVDPYAYQKPAYQADPRFDPGYKTGLEAVIDPAMANQIAQSRWTTPQDQSQSQQTLDEQMQYRNPEYNLFPYFQDGQQSESPFDGNSERTQMYADGGSVGGLGDLIKQQTPFGAAAPYVEALPITPGKAHIPEPPKMNWLPGLPGGGPSSGSGGGGGGGGGGMPKLPKMGGSKAASAGQASPEASALAAESGQGAHPAPTAETTPSAHDMGSAAAAPSADLGGLGGMGGAGGLGGLDFLSGLGGMFGGFKDGGRVHMEGGGAPGAAAGDGPSGFAGALGVGAGNIPGGIGKIGEIGSGTLGSLAPTTPLLAPTKGPMGDMNYKGWLSRAMELDPGRQTTPEEQGQPSLPEPGSQGPRPWMPGETQSKVLGNQNPGINPMLMMGMGKMGTGLALSSIIGQQQEQQNAANMQREAQAKRAEILSKPQAVGGYGQTLQNNIVNPNTGLFNVGYKAYYTPHYAEGGRVGMADGGGATIFYNSVYNAVYDAAKRQGAPHPEVLAKLGASQAALETEWGKHAPGNNYFGIKGPGSTYATKEVVDGKTVGTRASFRGYPSMQASANDYVRLMSSSPRYKNVYGAETPAKAFAAQGSSGYATDPRYGSKLARISEIGSRAPSSVASYGSPSTAPVRTLATRPLTGERAGVMAADAKPATPTPPPSATLSRINPADPSGPLLGAPRIPPSANMPQTAPAPQKPGFSLASLNPIGTAQADEAPVTLPQGVIPRIRPGFEPMQGPGQLAGTDITKQFHPSAMEAPIGMPRTGITGLDMTAFNQPGMAGDRDLMGATPQGFGTFGPSDFGPEASKPLAPWDDAGVAADTPAVAPTAAPAERAAPTERPTPAAKEAGKFWGDYRDYEPWKSDPIGTALDDIMGEKPMASHKGASMWDVGGGETQGGGFDLGDLFRQFGGRVNMQDGGDPLAGLDPELFSDEPMTDQPAGFAGLEDEVAPEDRVVATDMPERPVQPQQQQPGLGGLTSPITGKPMVWGPASQALLAAGLGMMASDRVNPLQAIGEGGLRGLEYYQSAEANERAQEAANARLAREMEQRKTAEQHWQAEQQHKRNVLESMERARRAGKIGVIGTDEFGYPIRGWVSGEKVGEPLEPSSGRGIPSVTSTKGAEGLHGEDYLNTLPGDMALQVKSIAEGRQSIPPGRYSQPLRRAVTQYDPDYSEQRKKVRDAFNATEPTKAGGQIIAGNTAIGHLGELSDAAHQLGNTGFKAWNWAKQHGKSLTVGNPKLEAFEATKDRFIEEATKFYRGTGGTEADIQRAIGRMSSANTPQELDAVIAQEAKLFESKVNSLEDQWRKTMKSDAIETGDIDYGVVRGHAKEALDKIQSRVSGGVGGIEAMAKKYGMTPEQLKAKYEEMKRGRQ